ncbi:MAG: class I SAM-dependent methyltransferase [Actinomycetota bacterium]|nr:class I SAM-dependent methyltransferase [Actinomycetota bacterium]MDQ2958715.1 class I SAM-dependent methyltransferase [Actinomycetota bacterium]
MTIEDRRPRGSGPGPITPDGCAVELYSRLPAHGEPAIVGGAVPAGCTILELGAGTGRITRPLLELGYRVTAVDESQEMLDRIHGAETVLESIENLELNRTFDAVLMMSYLVATADPVQRRAWLSTCRRHVRADGLVLLQRHSPRWFDTATPYERAEGTISMRLSGIERPADGLLTATMQYTSGDDQWSHTYTHDRWDAEVMHHDLEACGLRFDSFITPDEGWLIVRPE